MQPFHIIQNLTLNEIETLDAQSINKVKGYLEDLLLQGKNSLIDAIKNNHPIHYEKYKDYIEFINTNLLYQSEIYSNYSYKDIPQLKNIWNDFKMPEHAVYTLLCHNNNFFKTSLENNDAFKMFKTNFPDRLHTYLISEFERTGFSHANIKQREIIMQTYNLQDNIGSLTNVIKCNDLNLFKHICENTSVKNLLTTYVQKNVADVALESDRINIWVYCCEKFGLPKNLNVLFYTPEKIKELCKKDNDFFSELCRHHYFSDEQLLQMVKPLGDSQRNENVATFLYALDEHQLDVFLPEAQKHQYTPFKKMLKIFIAKHELDKALPKHDIQTLRPKI